MSSSRNLRKRLTSTARVWSCLILKNKSSAAIPLKVSAGDWAMACPIKNVKAVISLKVKKF